MKLDDRTAIEALYNAGLGSKHEIMEWVRRKQQATILDQFAMAAMPALIKVANGDYEWAVRKSYALSYVAMKERNNAA